MLPPWLHRSQLSHTRTLSGGVSEYSRLYKNLLRVLLQSDSLWEQGLLTPRVPWSSPSGIPGGFPRCAGLSTPVHPPWSHADSTGWCGSRTERRQLLELKILIYCQCIKNEEEMIQVKTTATSSCILPVVALTCSQRSGN